MIFYPCAALLMIAAAHGQETNSPGRAAPDRRPAAAALANRVGDGFLPPNLLTDEQRASLGQALQAQREKVRELQTKIRDARREMWSAAIAGTFDEDAVRKHALAVANLEAEMSVLRAKALSKIQPPLSREQIDQIRNAGPAEGGRMGPRAGMREGGASPRRGLTTTNRDENDLPAKQ